MPCGYNKEAYSWTDWRSLSGELTTIKITPVALQLSLIATASAGYSTAEVCSQTAARTIAPGWQKHRNSFGFIRNLAIAEDGDQMLQGCDVVEGIAVHDDYIGQLSRLQSP